MNALRLFKRNLRRHLMSSRWGRWLLIGFYEPYLDQFARVSTAIDQYHLRGAWDQKSLRYRLHRCIHRLEKGLSMPERRRGFGRENVLELMELMRRWRQTGEMTHPTFTWGLDVAATYFATLRADCHSIELDAIERTRLLKLERELLPEWYQFTPRPPEQRTRTPIRWADCEWADHTQMFEYIVRQRKSVRRWLDRPVPTQVIERAMEQALMAPSACNRQPFGVVAIQDRDRIQEAAQLLTGGGGFAEKAPLLLALTSDYGAYGGHEQRNLAFIDGSLAAMLFLLSLTTQGYGAVSMNWSVEVERDARMRRLLDLHQTQVILFFVAVGHPHPDALIPASIRRPAAETLRWIGRSYDPTDFAAEGVELVDTEQPLHA